VVVENEVEVDEIVDLKIVDFVEYMRDFVVVKDEDDWKKNQGAMDEK
jgi:hypothetical protein